MDTHNHQQHSSKGIMGWAQVIIFLLGNFATFFWYQRGIVDSETTLQTNVASLSSSVEKLQSALAQYNATQESSRTELQDALRRLARLEDKVFPTKDSK